MQWFDKMMIVVALFSWLAIGYMILFNFSQIIPFGITTNEMMTTYFTKSYITVWIVCLVSYLLAVRSWY